MIRVGPEAEARLDWPSLCDALEAGHRLPRAEIGDTFLYRGADTMLSRAAWIDGLGLLVKTATIFPGNAGPAIDGAATLFSDADGSPRALIDFRLLTKWKTAGDSLLGARRLARPDVERLLIVGRGTVARSLVEAYRALFPAIRVTLWSRSGAEALAAEVGAEAADDLERAVRAADIVACATMATEPVLRGAWLAPGTHVDLIGAYRPDMREADDAALRRADVFVDSRDTTLDHIGELRDPLARGVIARGDVVADLYDGDALRRTSAEQVTLYKNGGGAHLDLMCADWMLGRI